MVSNWMAHESTGRLWSYDRDACLLCGTPYDKHEDQHACRDYVPGKFDNRLPDDARIVVVSRAMGYRVTYLGPTSHNYARPPRGLDWESVLRSAASRLRAMVKPFEVPEAIRETHVELECYTLVRAHKVMAQRYYKYVPEINTLFLGEKEDLSYRL